MPYDFPLDRAGRRAWFVLVASTVFGSGWVSDVAKHLKLSRRLVDYWSRGERAPTVEQVAALALEAKTRARRLAAYVQAAPIPAGSAAWGELGPKVKHLDAAAAAGLVDNLPARPVDPAWRDPFAMSADELLHLEDETAALEPLAAP